MRLNARDKNRKCEKKDVRNYLNRNKKSQKSWDLTCNSINCSNFKVSFKLVISDVCNGFMVLQNSYALIIQVIPERLYLQIAFKQSIL